jgi:hypothetical protein
MLLLYHGAILQTEERVSKKKAPEIEIVALSF